MVAELGLVLADGRGLGIHGLELGAFGLEHAAEAGDFGLELGEFAAALEHAAGFVAAPDGPGEDAAVGLQHGAIAGDEAGAAAVAAPSRAAASRSRTR